MPGPYGTHPPRPSILSTWTDNLRASDTIRRRWNTIAYSDGGDGAARENKKVEPDGKVAARKSGEIFRVGREDGHEDGVCRQIAVRKGRKRNEKEKSKLDNLREEEGGAVRARRGIRRNFFRTTTFRFRGSYTSR